MKNLKIWLLIIVAAGAIGVATYFIVNNKIQEDNQNKVQTSQQTDKDNENGTPIEKEINTNNKVDKEGNRVTQSGEHLAADEGNGPVDWDTERKKELLEDPMYKGRKKLSEEGYAEARRIEKQMQEEGKRLPISEDVWKDYNVGVFTRDTSNLKKISLEEMHRCMQKGVEGVYKVDSLVDLEDELLNNDDVYNVSMEYGEDQVIFAEEYNMFWAFAPTSGIALRWSKDKNGDQIMEMKWIPAILAYSNQ